TFAAPPDLHSRLSAISAKAPSELPPPRPAPTGIRFSSKTSKSGESCSLNSPRSALDIRTIKLRSSQGKPGKSHRSERWAAPTEPVGSDRSKISVSKSPTVVIHESKG